ncbi:MAG: citrate lyase holo-[acyl-carrier protein] synthase, partial [Fenollaria timonensis]
SRTELGFAKRTCIVCCSDRFTCMREARHSQEEFNAVLNDVLINLDK